jgi:formate hydrogenlyase subunit 5
VRSEPAAAPERRVVAPLDGFAAAVESLTREGGHFAGLVATDAPEPSLRAIVALRGELVTVRAPVGTATRFPSVAPAVPGAAFPEREVHDRTGLIPCGHPDPRPVLQPDADVLTRRVVGDGTFAIPYGPIRSGVFESVQYAIDTGGEDVLSLTVRPFFKRRNLEQRFTGLSPDHGAYLAERVAGPASVAHVLAFASAVERVADVAVPPFAERWRVVHAELERIAAHLDVALKLAEDAALSVGAARFGALKEDAMRLRAALCGSRFGRGVVVPGGIRAAPLIGAAEALATLDRLESDFVRDRSLLLRTTSFTDRLIGSGRLDPRTVALHGGVGPVARACSLGVDARLERPYGAYARLGFRVARATAGDAMARLDVRLQEIDQSLHLIRQALERLDRLPPNVSTPLAAAHGEALGWAEAPMGEVIYWVSLLNGEVEEARILSPSLRNWPLFAESYRGDVLTDVSFIEHSFGLTPAGADR